MAAVERPNKRETTRSNPLERRPMTWSYFGFFDTLLQASTNEAEKRLAQTKRLIQRSSRGPEREPPKK
jgi:hypothetical protein